jgi:replicative DNA helicase
MNNEKKNKQTPTIDDTGRTLPQAPDAERALLSALITFGELFPKVESLLREEDFYDKSNQIIFRTINNLYDRREPIDLSTLIATLIKSGDLERVGGTSDITQSLSGFVSAASLEYNANIIHQKAIARKIIKATADVQARAFDPTEDVADLIEAFEQAATDIGRSASGARSIDMNEALQLAVDKAAQTQKDRQEGKQTAVPTGLSALDHEFAGGWRAPELIIIGGRTSMGKTQHALSFAKAAALAGMDVMFVTIEMSAVQLINRLLLEDDQISPYNLKTGQMSNEEWKAIDFRVGALRKMKLHISDSSDTSDLPNIKSEARRLSREGKLKLLVIDYLQLISSGRNHPNLHMEIGHITKELKKLAKELDIPVILLSQLTRPQKADKGSEPQLIELKESGQIENDADIVIFIHKPDYYNPNVEDSAGRPWKGRGKLIIAKNREGVRNRDIIFHHDAHYKKIFDPPGTQHESRKNEEFPF